MDLSCAGRILLICLQHVNTAMQRTLLPGTNLSATRLGLGTASLHHAFRSRDRQALLSAALDAGFTHFDTARMYGEGMAERELGQFFTGGLRQQVTIATKFGIPARALFERFPALMYAQRAMGGVGRRLGLAPVGERVRALSREAAENSLTRSLKALRTDWVDILFVHEPVVSDIAALQNLAEWLLQQKSSGRVRYLGLAGSAANCVAVMRQVEGVFDVLQVEDSLAVCEAGAVLATGWPLQVTFGYMRQSRVTQPQLDALSVLKAALARNSDGMVLVSSRQPERLRALAAVAAE